MYQITNWEISENHPFPFNVGDIVKTTVDDKVFYANVTSIMEQCTTCNEQNIIIQKYIVYKVSLEWKDEDLKIYKLITDNAMLIIHDELVNYKEKTMVDILYEKEFKQHKTFSINN